MKTKRGSYILRESSVSKVETIGQGERERVLGIQK